jgi:hypothetical protein
MPALNLFVIWYDLLKWTPLSLLMYQFFMSLVKENYEQSCQRKLMKKLVFQIKDTMEIRVQNAVRRGGEYFG